MGRNGTFRSSAQLKANTTKTWGRRLFGVAGVGTLLGGLLVVINPGPASAQSPIPGGALVVSNGATDPAGCATAPYATIQSAVNAAQSGDTVYVCAGTYDESVTINEPLTLDGAQYGVSAPSRSGPETVIEAPASSQGPIVYGSGAPTGEVDGFTLNGDNSANNPTGISAFGSSGTGYTWADNIIENNAMGINFNASGASASTLIEGNLFLDNNATPSNGDSGTGIFFTNGPANNVTISNNTFQDEGLATNGGGNADINTTGSGSSSAPNSNLVVSGNAEILDNSSGNDVYENNFLALFITNGAQITGNTITDSDATDPHANSAMYVSGGVTDATISGNTVTGGLGNGLNLNNDFYSGGSDSGDVVTDNTITDRSNGIKVNGVGYTDFTVSDNTISGSSNNGIWVAAGDGGTVSGNTVSGSTINDCEDDTSGSGTSNTDDTWTNDVGVTNSPSGLCLGPVDVTTTPTDSTITLGDTDTDKASVVGDTTDGPPTGSVTFNVAGPCVGGVFSGCGPLTFQAVGTAGVSTSGSASATATSPSYAPTSVGLYCFEGVYSGSTAYVGGSDYEAAECFTVGMASSTTGSSPTSSSIVLGNSESDTATVTGNATGGSPTGKVSFYQCGPTPSPEPCSSTAHQVGQAENLTMGDNQSTTASIAFTPTGTGYWCFAADYPGDSNYTASSDATSTDGCFDVTAATSSTSSTLTDSTITLGQADTDLAMVTGNSAGGSPTGTVSFYQCGVTSVPSACITTTPANQVGGLVTLSPGTSPQSTATSASFTPQATGYYCVAAVYSGDGNYNASSDTTTDECVHVTLASPGTVTTPGITSNFTLGDSNTDTAVITGNAFGGSPSGSVTFFVCGPTAGQTSCTPGAAQTVGSPVSLTAGSGDTATATSTSFTPTATGYWCFAVSYPGDNTYYAPEYQAGTSECFDVAAAATSTVTTPSKSSMVLGGTVSDGATVTGNTTGGDPGGTVSFYECGKTATATACTSLANQVGSAVTVTGGATDTATASSASITPTSTGYWCFAAVYSGNTSYLGSADKTVDECVDVTAASTTSKSTPAASTILLGASDTDSVAVTGNAAAGSPTSTVSFYQCGPTSVAMACTSEAHPVGSPVTVTAGANNTATATSTSFTPTATGYWCFAAVYAGDSNYTGSSDTTVDECVDVTPATTTTKTTPGSTTIVLGTTTDTDGATVTGNATGGDPTGTVSFYECGPSASAAACTTTTATNQVGGPVTVTGGANNTATATSASFTPTSTGYWCFAGVYSGSTSYLTSTATTTDECVQVTAATTGTVTKPTSATITLGATDTDGATVTGNGPGGSPTGTVTFYQCGPSKTATACTTTSATNQVGTPVSVTAGASDISTATSASFTPTSTGYWCFAATYSGDGNYQGSSDELSAECFDVTATTSTTTTTPTNTTITLGQADTDLATVTGNTAGGSPTGTVTFYQCGMTASPTPCASTANPVGGSVALTAGPGATATATSASFTPTSTGYWCFTADYSGDSNYFSSSDTTTDECVNVVSSGDTVTSSAPTSATITLGGTDSDSATVTGNPAGGSPTGTVSFYDCGPTTEPTPCTSTARQVGSAVTVTAGAGNTATAKSTTFTPSGAGYWCFGADYSGGASYFSSFDNSTDECFDVSAVASATSTAPASTTIQLGATNTDQVAVTGNATGGSPTGTVAFYVCGPTTTATPCTSTAVPVGSAVHVAPGAGNASTATSASFTATAVGYWCFAGTYSGSTDYLASSDTSTDECFHVTTANSSTTTAPSKTSLVTGGSVSDVATVTGNAGGSSPTGTVTFYECGPTTTATACTTTAAANEVGTAVTVTAGANNTATASSITVTPDALGYWCFAGHYSGSTDYQASADTSTDECVDVISAPTPLAITTTTLPNATKGTVYTTTIKASGGLQPYVWSSTTLPKGLTLNKTTGVLSGTPTKSGKFTITFRVRDSTLPHHEKVHQVLMLTIAS